MKIVAVDDEGPALLKLEEEFKKAFPEGRIYTFATEKEARAFINTPAVKAAEYPYNVPGAKESTDRKERNIYIRTFGNFEMFLDDRPVRFSHSKAKELLAYLVDRRGSGVTTPEAYSVLWEDYDYTPSSKDKVQHAKKDLRDTLKSYGIGDILMSSRNWLAIDANKVNCDYYDYLEGKPKAVSYYNGEYMSQYSWAEHTVGMLESRLKR